MRYRNAQRIRDFLEKKLCLFKQEVELLRYLLQSEDEEIFIITATLG
jgi:hypothetical protein